MLQLFKNQVVTSVAKQQVEIRQLELDWYTNNYWTLSQQAALLAGFAFSQITTALPSDVSFGLEASYLLLAALSLGMQLCVIVTTTFCCMWGPGLALRGPDGVRSVNSAVESLKAEQGTVFGLFVAGLSCFFASNILLLWCYFEESVAFVSSLFLGGFVVVIAYYTLSLTLQLRVAEAEAVEGNIDALKAYENIADLDACYASAHFKLAEPHQQTAEAAAPSALGGTSFRPLQTQGPQESWQDGPGVPSVTTEATPQGFLGTMLELFDWD
ncbi:uncharacterized protein LOC34620254 [Cyclospora cayetanensis]|uniref:Uncharacterized protein LOC34620254 n=1 Tax=Cyclospora cayetanensis TaxID=88456 RepID=A0A6P6RRE3_9EIME|nr:uncharacterized protein LOC34620254 [Cyclospora cayetanensis]